MIGRVFGKLTVLGAAARGRRNQLRFRCRCACGAEVVRIGIALRSAVARGQQPNCGCSRRKPGAVRRDSADSARPTHRRVTVSNYRRWAADFTREEVARLGEIMRRHDRAECFHCSRGKACAVAAEAVEVVLIERDLGPTAPPGERRCYSLDYTRQGMYVG